MKRISIIICIIVIMCNDIAATAINNDTMINFLTVNILSNYVFAAVLIELK